MATITCRVCKTKADKDSAICLKPKIYVCCEECKEQYISKENNKANKSKDSQDRQEFIAYLKSMCSQELNYKIVGSMLKKMMKDNPSFTYNGMKYTLWYIHDVLNINITGVGIIPYYYDEAKRYYEKKQKMKQAIKQSNVRQETKTICRRIKKIEDEDIFE